ncbi:hypothetical protein C8Q77DRAFT_298393 [Trametes polyzona]|nr:hypothetical protein C8Q77DRAFT_298393 [Trametes polyzona]
MAAVTKSTKLPDWVYVPPQMALEFDKRTRQGVYNLSRFEEPWRDRYDYLKKRGYLLRPRYHPEWTPSWIGTNISPDFCEDSRYARRPLRLCNRSPAGPRGPSRVVTRYALPETIQISRATSGRGHRRFCLSNARGPGVPTQESYRARVSDSSVMELTMNLELGISPHRTS